MSWKEDLYMWLIRRAETIYNLDPFPEPIEHPEQVFYQRVEDGKQKQKQLKEELNYVSTR